MPSESAALSRGEQTVANGEVRVPTGPRTGHGCEPRRIASRVCLGEPIGLQGANHAGPVVNGHRVGYVLAVGRSLVGRAECAVGAPAQPSWPARGGCAVTEANPPPENVNPIAASGRLLPTSAGRVGHGVCSNAMAGRPAPSRRTRDRETDAPDPTGRGQGGASQPRPPSAHWLHHATSEEPHLSDDWAIRGPGAQGHLDRECDLRASKTR